MATYPHPRSNRSSSSQMRVRSLLRLNEAVQKINSTLDLNVLLDRIVNDIAMAFGCLEAELLLKEPGTDEVRVTAITGCTQCHKGDRFTIGRDGLVGYTAATGMPVYTPDVSKDSRYIACEPTTRSEFDIPLIAHGEVIGVFSTQHPEIDGFPAEQRALLEALAAHMAVAIENARLFQREREQTARLRAQEEEAHRLQQALFPKSLPSLPGFIVEGHCVPAGAVGGDFYDFIPLHSNDSPPGPLIAPPENSRQRWGLVLADVAGKGMAAALLMSATRGILRSVARNVASPAAVLRHVNRALKDDLPEGRFVTMVYAVLDAARRTLTYANAGHPWPIYADGGSPQFLQTAAGLPLGIGDGDYDERVVKLPPDACVLFYSDGASEAVNAAGEEYGSERMMQRAGAKTPAQAILADVRAFAAHRPLADDATVIVVRAGVAD
jgi:sigma-B regulation protein RsbU (phosphoserine phosphatase)